MELTIWLLSSAVGLLVIMLILLIVAFRLIAKHLTQTIDRERERNQTALLNLSELQMQQKPTELISLLSKSVSLLSTKDPLSFQQVQMMDSVSQSNTETVDNSDHGELQQWIEDNDELTPIEKELLREADPNFI